jgi:Gpi18-like mannosyltransferase
VSHTPKFTTNATGSSGYTGPEIKIFCAILLTALVKIKISLWSVTSHDAEVYFLPWLEFIRAHGHWLALRYPVGQYFPFYLYLLATSSYLDQLISPLGQIKLIPLTFDFYAAAMAYRVVKQLEAYDDAATPNSYSPIVAFFAVFALPSLLIDGALWGQCDSILVSLLLATVFYVLRGSPIRAAICFGLAFSFKIQAVFLGPFLLALLLRGRLRFQAALLIPLVWVASITPIVLLGRSFRGVLQIFTQQSQEYNALAMNVANPWCLYERFHLGYPFGLHVGLVLTILAAGILTFIGYKNENLGLTWLFLFATTTLVVMPYIMPKMHDRYFLAGQVFLVILACHKTKFLVPAALLECALILPYINYLVLPQWDVHSLEIGVCASTATIYILMKSLLKKPAASQSDLQDSRGITAA